MTISFYNSLTKKVEPFIPLKEGEVKIYSCGPTVYFYTHIGNLRAFTFNDLLVRYLRYRGFDVTHVMNFTDVDDKTIKGAKENNQSLKEYTSFYGNEVLKDFASIGLKKPDIIPKATEEIDAMVEIISLLLDKGYAYKNEKGDIYFRISSFAEYGKLADLDKRDLKENADNRLNNADEYDKDNVYDFALWKAWDEDDGDVFWDTKIGKGRPGWHIECSAMSAKYLGQPFDIHTGGVDLIFPHHTNEIAQSECAFGKKFVNYWLHNGHLFVNGKKMSKSLGNFYNLRDLFAKGYSAEAIRYELIKAHYRQELDFKEANLETNTKIVKRFRDFVSRLKEVSGEGAGILSVIDDYKKSFIDAMDDDLNTPNGLAVVFEFMNAVNKETDKISKLEAEKILEVFVGFMSVFGFDFIENETEDIPENVAELLNKRNEARKMRDFALADDLKAEIIALGFEVKDTPKGTKVQRL